MLAEDVAPAVAGRPLAAGLGYGLGWATDRAGGLGWAVRAAASFG
ncbi:hypothetical protein RR48_10080 [Papilio machaon]|uniref:Uncharacterized protein n=1 Tax=Papilio machaon TaxID=76193 RepID=A0A194R0X4_PAPMA|nr:hypothetical protein RR48_10080 [Papilio machaon]